MISDDDLTNLADLAQRLMVEVSFRLEDLAAEAVELQTSHGATDSFSERIRGILALLEARSVLLSQASGDVFNSATRPP